jgi:hypothetical protein
MSEFESWISAARNVPIRDVLAARSIRLTEGSRNEPHGPCPRCGGEDRFYVRTKQQRFVCRQCAPSGGDVIDLVQWLDSCDFVTACETLTGKRPPPRKGNGLGGTAAHKIVTASFDYENESGDVLFFVERVEYLQGDGRRVLKDDGKIKKIFRQKRPDPAMPGQWLYNVDGVRVVPYRLPELVEAIAQEHTIFIAEGERKVDALLAWNVPATCNAMGAGNWTDKHSAFLQNADVVLMPDNDDAGFRHVQAVGASLNGIAARIRVLMLPGLPPKGDIVDWIKSGGTREQLDALVVDAPLWVPPPEADKPSDEQKAKIDEQKAKAEAREQELIDRLSRVTGVEYDRQRREAARELGVRRSSIDREVEARRQQRDEEAGPPPLFGHWEVEPWSEPVDLAELLDDIVKQIKRYNVLPDHLADTVALWDLYTWNFEHATHSPFLRIGSPVPESGKTTLLRSVAHLVRRPLTTVGISEAALYRSVEKWGPCLMIDEAENLVQNEFLLALVNSIWTRGCYVLRCIGEDKEPHPFPTFTPLALAMNGKSMAGATKSRTIEVWMRRKLASEKCEHFNHLDNNEFGQLRQRSLRNSLDIFEVLKQRLDPSIPQGMDNRVAENFRLQFALADLAGGSWPERARSAAMKITGTVDVSSRNARLLAAIKAVYEGRLEEEKKNNLAVIDHDIRDIFIGTGDLIKALLKEPTSEFHGWANDKPISQHQLWRVLDDFEIRSTPDKAGKSRGFYGWQFGDAWARYL